MHLIYTRYWTKVMRDMGLVKFDEPVTRLLTQGMINKETYACPEHEWLFPEQVTDAEDLLDLRQEVITGRVEKMSKSKKNAVDPIEMINIHGADALRLFVLFAGPPEKDKEWSDTGVEGAAQISAARLANCAQVAEPDSRSERHRRSTKAIFRIISARCAAAHIRSSGR